MTIQTGRICAVCGKRQAPNGEKDTYGFHTILARNGVPGDKAHRYCISQLQNNVNRKTES